MPRLPLCHRHTYGERHWPNREIPAPMLALSVCRNVWRFDELLFRCFMFAKSYHNIRMTQLCNQIRCKKQYSYLRTFSSIPIGVWFAVNYVINSDSNRKHGCRGLDPRWTWGFQSALSWVRRWRHRSLLLWRYCDVIDNDNVIVVISPDCFTAHGAPCGTTPPWAKLIREH